MAAEKAHRQNKIVLDELSVRIVILMLNLKDILLFPETRL